MAAEITCKAVQCIYNDNGHCVQTYVDVNEDGFCEDYESRREEEE